MNYTYLHHQIGLSLLHGIGPIKARELLLSLENPEDIFSKSLVELQKITGLRKQFIKNMKRKEVLEKSVAVVEHMNKHSINSIFYTSQDYPRRLRQCVDAPVLLYQKGASLLNEPKLVAIVGTRNASSYGKTIVQELIASFEGQNITVVSGLALGIDSYVHRYCLEYNVPTIGVLGHGFDRIYPSKNRELAKKMLQTGALLTEFIPGTDPDRENFPKRNRIVAGMTDATIVVESKQKGGSLITARLSNDYNRDVFAYPGNINVETSQGCNQLISEQKAHLIQSPDDFLRLMNWKEKETKQAVQKVLFSDLSPAQQTIVTVLSNVNKVQVDVLSLKSSLPITQLNQELFSLELEGIIRSVPGNAYALV
ncbi:MAG: DNA-processing protein DprA [Crocinitomicaceae bacterium]|nr:DNA-processing protein DprA [Crocinitomicaceae bacterium]